jgi:hypothetical protein
LSRLSPIAPSIPASGTVRSDPKPSARAEALVNGNGLLSRFLRFRVESVVTVAEFR